MSTISGKESEALMAEIRERNAKARADALAKAKADAAARGKEPFDLAKLETMADTTSQGIVDAEDVRRARFEEMYYVEYPNILTIEAFAEKVEELNKW
jgi:hypothetical protein